MSEAYVLARSEERLIANRANQMAKINTLGVEVIGKKGSSIDGWVAWDKDVDSFPTVVAETEWGKVRHQVSWWLIDDLAVAASRNERGKVRV